MESEMKSNTFITKAGAALVICLSGWSVANSATLDEIPQAAPNTVSNFGKPMDNSQLGSYRGGFALVENDMKLVGSVKDNYAAHIWSGDNIIADGAFSNAGGLPMVVQNSGSNVLIQNATIVNVQLK
jgi:hypothetical protein